jgi:hypothetical protein
VILSTIKVKLRFDYPGQAKNKKFFGGKSPEQLADETREHNVAMMRNVPLQGIRIEDIDMSQDIYSLVDEITAKKVAYAPVVITFLADGIEDVIKFVVKEEFRTVEIIEPAELRLSNSDTEKLLFKVNQELSEYRDYLLRKIDNWK